MKTRHTVFFSSLVAAAAVLLSAVQGCSLITKTDRTRIDETTGGGSTGASTGGSGGTATTSTGGTPTGGTGGAPCTTECCAPSDCPATDNECVLRTCEGGVCGTQPVAANVPVSSQTGGDCKLVVCDGLGATKAITEAADVPDDGKQCTVDKCVGSTPKSTASPAGEACDEDGGHECDGSGACLECLSPNDCASKVCTVAGACAPAQCGDGVKNGDETDLDCGGVCGATCTTGKACKDAGDCIDEVCGGAPLKCLPPSCSDGLENGAETDVDCGGPMCGATCGPGEGCAQNADCTGDACTGSFCLPSCSDGVKNNSETGLDCGGPVCVETCDVATPCVVASDCTSGACVDAVCCGTPCDSECTACSAAKKGSGEDGVCGAVAQGTDPHSDCDVAPPATCGDETGACDGAGSCEKYAAGTACGDAASCTNGVQTNADGCDGAGSCDDAGTAPCGLYACGATTCKASCGGDGDCASSAFCSGTQCVAKKTNGATCAGAGQCTSGFCADGRCCDAACTGSCVACSVAAGGGADGACTPVPSGQDPAGDCGGNGLCDGNGGCKKVNGEACVVPSECLSGSCADGFCCNTPCVGLCQACSNLKKGSGANGSCGFVGASLDPDEECPGVTLCSGGGACALIATGSACALNGECQSGFCVDGLCCGAQCLGFCQACSAALTGGADGACADITPGTDPDDECPGADSCAGNFSCAP